MGANEWINKAKDFATGHKDQVQGVLDKAEDVVKAKTGDKYDDKIAKGRGALEDKLGFTGGGQSGAATGGPAAGDAAGQHTGESEPDVGAPGVDGAPRAE
ncbi:antitoxin [Leekyejoonella antrihumi]|uniref:Antitoxin n=1 Tax=Leekyejoonella antrihumi TaxID=1660198 RepID=A0A563DTD0_9MICO|nr:antitoxin [Leekyejoonella antrihumi]TWP33419.1 antitoxin [Leekyejoonella antrihumi]